MSLVEAAEAVRQRGRFGDTVLMHVNPEEAKALAHGSGGYLTTNPDTGLPEAFLPALLPILGGLGGTALATSGALTGLGAAGAFLSANPFLAGAIGSGLGKFIGTGDLGEGLKTGLISGVTGGLLQGLSGGEFIRSPEAIGGAEALAAAPQVGSASADVLQKAVDANAAAAIEGAGMAEIYPPNISTANIQLDDVPLGDFGKELVTQDTLSAAKEAANLLPAGYSPAQNVITPGEGILSPSTAPYVDPLTGVLREGNLNITGELAGGVGSAIIGDTLSPQTVNFDDVATRRSYDAPERFAKRERFLPDEDYRGGVDPEFDYFGDITYAADGGPIKMQDGGGLEALQQMAPTASGLGAMAGVMDDGDPDSAMMQIQSMMMEGQQGDEDTANIIIDEAISAIRGEHPQPEVAIQAFVQEYGQNALDVLVTQVQQEEMLEQMGRNQDMLVEGDGMIEGMGKGRDDMVQATLEGEQDVLLSDGEFVLPADVVSGIGDGSSKAGEAELMALIDRVRTRRTGTKEPPNMVGEVLPA